MIATGVAGGVEPRGDLDRIEAQQPSPFDERDDLLLDETANVAFVDSQMVGDGMDVYEAR